MCIRPCISCLPVCFAFAGSSSMCMYVHTRVVQFCIFVLDASGVFAQKLSTWHADYGEHNFFFSKKSWPAARFKSFILLQNFTIVDCCGQMTKVGYKNFRWRDRLVNPRPAGPLDFPPPAGGGGGGGWTPPMISAPGCRRENKRQRSKAREKSFRNHFGNFLA